MDSPAEGTILAGKYSLRGKLGEGAMGSVWAAEHLTLRSEVAIKLINPQIAAHPGAHVRFLREARAAAALRSPYVVKILDHGIDENTPYIVMELLEGESLATRLRRVGRLPPHEMARLLGNVAHAVGKAHEAGIVHRDLKPDNIFVVKNDDDEVAKVLDFGVAKIVGLGTGPSGLGTRTGAAVGTPYYMSPEQAEGTKLVDFRSDLWSLGVTAFECLIGRRPFESDGFSWVLAICSRPLPIPSQSGEVPPGFDAWFARACARNADGRFPSAKDQAAELHRICGLGRASLPSEPVQNPKARSSAPVVATIEPTLAISSAVTTTEPLSTVPDNRRQGSFRTLAPYLLVGTLGTGALVVYLGSKAIDATNTPPDSTVSTGAAGRPAPSVLAFREGAPLGEVTPPPAASASSSPSPHRSSASPSIVVAARSASAPPATLDARLPPPARPMPRPQPSATAVAAPGSRPPPPAPPIGSINLGI
jgi:serine/threonine-protein kinase